MPPVFVVKMPLAQSNLVPQGVIWGDVDPGIRCKVSLRWHENRALKDSWQMEQGRWIGSAGCEQRVGDRFWLCMDRGEIASGAIGMQDVYPVGEGKAEVENSWKGLGSILGRN